MKHTESKTPSSAQTWLSAFLPPLAWAGLIFFFSSQSVLAGLEVSTLDFIFKKSAHMFVYGVLYLLLHRAFRLTFPNANPVLVWLAPLAICFVYAVSDEYHQSLVPGRFPSSRDIGYDMLGVAIAILRQYRYI